MRSSVSNSNSSAENGVLNEGTLDDASRHHISPTASQQQARLSSDEAILNTEKPTVGETNGVQIHLIYQDSDEAEGGTVVKEKSKYGIIRSIKRSKNLKGCSINMAAEITTFEDVTAISRSDEIKISQDKNQTPNLKKRSKEAGLKNDMASLDRNRNIFCLSTVGVFFFIFTVGVSFATGFVSLTSHGATVTSANPRNNSGEYIDVSETPPSGSPTLVQIPTTNPRDISAEHTDVPETPPTASPTQTPKPTLMVATFVPGKLTVLSNKLRLSEGLKCRIIAETGAPIHFTGISKVAFSTELFHDQPDGAAVYEDLETGGWVYVSNSEVIDPPGQGGVFGIYFDRNGDVIDYKPLLQGTTANCSGGKTPWGTWVSCEEPTDHSGSVFQVDPFGRRPPQEMTVGIHRKGKFEAFANDIRDKNKPRFFFTEDKPRGTLRRFTPALVDWQDPWNILHADGTVDYLVLKPNDSKDGGTYEWTGDLEAAKNNALSFYTETEGVDVYMNELFLVSKRQAELIVLDLDTMAYTVHSTKFGMFDGQPDQIKRLVKGSRNLLYFCEEGGKENGIHARDENGWFYTIAESDELEDETTGLAFSPNGKHMYVSYQHTGIIYDIWREDGLPFHGKTLNVKYHQLKEH